MKKPLIEQKQPFGEVHKMAVHPTDGNPVGGRNRIAEGEQVMNNGFTMHPSFADRAPNAEANACRNGHQPFAFVGKNFGEFK